MPPTSHLWSRRLLIFCVVLAVGLLALAAVGADMPAVVLDHAQGFWRGVRGL
ncbi:MAG TPA: hypothetical protein VLJ59_11195 [Mycobacteriales bacterium]|nr:hypothetical protein [Mycobacteriales bacterium]